MSQEGNGCDCHYKIYFRDRGRSVIEGAHIHIFGFCLINFFKLIVFTVCEPEFMNMGPLNYRSSAVSVFLIVLNTFFVHI